MTKCAGCRVRHLNCDAYSVCTQCKKSGRECVRLNVRFRHLVCPLEKISRADYSKYEFFFDAEQTWVDTNGNIEFVVESDSSAYASPMDELGNNVFVTVGQNVEPRPALVEQASSPFRFKSTSPNPTVQASVLDDDPPGYLAALQQRPHDPPGNGLPDHALEIPAHLLRETSRPGEESPSSTRVYYQERLPPAPEPAWPLKTLQEGKLLQHFITHLAPWVCTNVLTLR